MYILLRYIIKIIFYKYVNILFEESIMVFFVFLFLNIFYSLIVLFYELLVRRVLLELKFSELIGFSCSVSICY